MKNFTFNTATYELDRLFGGADITVKSSPNGLRHGFYINGEKIAYLNEMTGTFKIYSRYYPPRI